MAKVFVVDVALSWGEKRQYLVANDVEPGLAHRLATRDNWQEVIVDALINVPVGPYLPANDVIPPIATGKVVGVHALDLDEVDQGLQRTRSQFIMAAVWRKQSATTNYNFLHHDYVPQSQAQIKADVNYWCNGVRNPKVTAQTKRRITMQEQRLAKELKK